MVMYRVKEAEVIRLRCRHSVTF